MRIHDANKNNQTKTNSKREYMVPSNKQTNPNIQMRIQGTKKK